MKSVYLVDLLKKIVISSLDKQTSSQTSNQINQIIFIDLYNIKGLFNLFYFSLAYSVLQWNW